MHQKTSDEFTICNSGYHIRSKEQTMTVSKKKRRERFFVESTARYLRKSWCLHQYESPDFLVTEGEANFGLEVREVFVGNNETYGSHMKRLERMHQKKILHFKQQYENHSAIPLKVQILGSLDDPALDCLVPTLLNMQFSPESIHDHLTLIELGGVRIYVARRLRACWELVNDRTGWVDRNPKEVLQRAVIEKAGKLENYRQNSGFCDIRLLLIADKLHKSGLMILDPEIRIDHHGFHQIYLFSHPENVVQIVS